MNFVQKLFIFAGPLLLLALTAIAGYAFSQSRFLSLPIPQALGLFTVVLPLITGISTQGAVSLIRRSSKKESYTLTIPLIAVIGFQLIYETIIATLAMTHILPSSSLSCGLNEKWLRLFRNKDANAIRAIQDAFDCCGLRSVIDKAFPFSGGPSECANVYGRTKSCFAEWRQAEQTNAGLLLIVALVVFLIKVVSIVSLLTSPSWARSWTPHPLRRHSGGGGDVEEAAEDNRANMRRLIEDGAGEGHYQDEPAREGSSRAIEPLPAADRGRGPRVEPSPLLDDGGNEWQNGTEAH